MNVPALLVLTTVLAVAWSDDCQLAPGCPTISPMADLDFDKYKGIWIEYFHGYTVKYQCAVYNYMYNNDQNNPKYNITYNVLDQNDNPATGSYDVQLVTTPCMNPAGKYMHFVTGDSDIPAGLNLFVLYTDYTNCTIEYGCVKNQDGTLNEILCVQGRNGTAPPTMNDITPILAKNNINIMPMNSQGEICPMP